MTRWEQLTAQQRADELRANHIAGAPVNASTYSNLGCRCAGCSHFNSKRVSNYLSRTPGARKQKARYEKYRRHRITR